MDIYGLGDLSEAEVKEDLKTTEQIKKEWLDLRRGKFTASEFYRVMTYEKLGVHLPDGAKKYAEEKAIEQLTAASDLDRFVTKEMQWGIDHELEAIEAFTDLYGFLVLNIGINQQYLAFNESVGGTPDGVIHDIRDMISGIEVKCPSSRVHGQYLKLKNSHDLKRECANYYWQVQGLMMITNCDYWHFISFDPRFIDERLQLKHLLIERNNTDIEHLKERLMLAVEWRDNYIKEIADEIDYHVFLNVGIF